MHYRSPYPILDSGYCHSTEYNRVQWGSDQNKEIIVNNHLSRTNGQALLRTLWGVRTPARCDFGHSIGALSLVTKYANLCILTHCQYNESVHPDVSEHLATRINTIQYLKHFLLYSRLFCEATDSMQYRPQNV